MPPSFSLTFTPPFRDLRGRFAVATKKLLDGARRRIAAEGGRLRDLARDGAPRKTGQFASKIGYRSRVGTGAAVVSLELVSPQPLSKFIVGGTIAHAIGPKNKQALFWEGARHPVRAVWHPGTRPNPFIGRAYRRWLPGARAELNSIARDWVADVKGGR